MSYVIGIDLGTTYSCAGVWRNGHVDMITNSMGERIMPSIVSFTETHRLVGNEVRTDRTKNYENTVYDAKRLIGRNFNDQEVQRDMKLWPFKVEKGNRDKPKIIVKYKKEKKEFYPEQISAMILEKLKENAETYLGTKVSDAVITVPAYFNNSQRQATIDAGRIAGLNVIKTINEPTAAAIAYGIRHKKEDDKKNICVFDLGGGTFDVTILEIKNEKFTVKAVGGDSHLGGQDFDNELIKFCVESFKKSNNKDISQNFKVLRKLKIECERVKRDLSSSLESNIDIESLIDDEDFHVVIYREDLNNACKKLFDKCIETLKNTLNDSGLSKKDITEVVLVGGSTRIPEIQKRISDFFGKEKKISKAINADEAVAQGAAIEAALNNLGQEENLESLVVVDVCPLSLGIEVLGGLMDVIIKRNTPIPCEKTNNYVTTSDNQTSIGINVYEGERELIKDNCLIEKYTIKNITKAPRGKSGIQVTFSIDKDLSLLKVIAKENKVKKNPNEKDNIVYKEITTEKRDENEIERMIEEGIKMKKADLERRHKIEKINEIEEILYNLQNENNPNYSKDKKKIDQKVNEIKTWIKNNSDSRIEDYQNKINDINNFINSL